MWSAGFPSWGLSMGKHTGGPHPHQVLLPEITCYIKVSSIQHNQTVLDTQTCCTVRFPEGTAPGVLTALAGKATASGRTRWSESVSATISFSVGLTGNKTKSGSTAETHTREFKAESELLANLHVQRAGVPAARMGNSSLCLPVLHLWS